ncbi:MAG: hypothetical protein Q9171_003648 [Xanthocarpia ochracea]
MSRPRPRRRWYHNTQQDVLLEYANLKTTCPDGIYMSLTPGKPTQWSGVLFVREVIFNTDIFHPLVTPLTTYTYGASSSNSGAVGATDVEPLPPGGFGLSDAFPHWFGVSKRRTASSVNSSRSASAPVDASEREIPEMEVQPSLAYVPPRAPIANVLDYVKRSFDDADVLNGLPAEAATNPGAWKAWQAHRCSMQQQGRLGQASSDHMDIIQGKQESNGSRGQPKHSDDWSWEGVWERRVRKGIDASISDQVLFGASGGNELLLIPIPDDPDLTPRPLHIKKRKRQSSRHSYTTYGSLATGSLAPAAKVRRAATMSYPPTFLKSQSTQDRERPTDPTRSSRAVTLGTTQWADANRRSASRNVSPSSRQLSKPLSKGEEIPPLDWNCSLDSDSQHTVRRLPSIKHRILSRVMNTLIGKPSSSQLNAEDRGSRRPSVEESTSNDSAGQTTDARTSLSTTERSSSSDTNLETALSQFPEPPGSPLIAPASISALEQAKIEFQAYRRLHAPSDAVIIRPEILITPEVASVDANKDRSLYLAVEISAVAGPGRESQNHCFYGLDVAVIIDNS